jgi:chromosome segregation ATPase
MTSRLPQMGGRRPISYNKENINEITTPRTTPRKGVSYILNTIKFSKTAPEPTIEFLDTIKQNIESIEDIDDLNNIKSLLETYNRINWPEINESQVSDTLQSVNDRLVNVYTENTQETFKYIEEILYVYTTDNLLYHVQQIIKNGMLDKLSLNDLNQVSDMIENYLETNRDSDKGKSINSLLLSGVNNIIKQRLKLPRYFNPTTEMPVKPPSVFTYNPVPVNAPSSFSFVPVNPLMEKLKKEKDDLKKEKDELISSNTRLEAEKKDLEAEKKDLESSNSQIADLVIKIVEKEGEIQMNKQTIASLNSEIAQLNARIKELESKNEALLKEVEQSKLQLNKLSTTNELINQELKKLKSENTTLLKGINEERVKMEDSKLMSKTTSEFIDSLQDGINKLTKKLEINNEQIVKLNEEKLSNSEQIENLKKELEQLTSVNTSLKAQISKLEAGLEQGTTTLAEIKKEKSKLQSELQEKTKELENLKTNFPKEFLQVYTKKSSMQEKFNVRENGYKENIRLLRIDISELTSKIVEYSNIEKELRSINSAIQKELEAAKLENQQLSNENTGLKDRLKKLKQSLETKLIEKINKIKEMEQDNERERLNESKKLKDLQDALSLSNLHLDDANRKIALHVDKETTNNAQLEQLKSIIQTLKAEISQLKSELEKKRVLIIQENNTGLLNQKKELENMLQKLNTQIVFSKHELSSINEEINKHEHKVFTSVNKGNYKLRENEYNHEYNRIERIIRNVREVTISSNLSCQRGTLANRSNTKCVKISY